MKTPSPESDREKSGLADSVTSSHRYLLAQTSKTHSYTKLRRMTKFPTRGTLYEVEEGLRLMPLFDDRDLVPCITQDATSHEVLMLGWMNREALTITLNSGFAHYFSRARNQLWRKGERSGQAQVVQRILIDDDQDCLLIKVQLTGGASCHIGYRSCFFRELNWTDRKTDFSLRMLESKKVYDPVQAYGAA